MTSRGGLNRGAFLLLYAGIVVLPLVLAKLARDLERDFASDLATGLGIAAYAMLLVSFVVTGRFEVARARPGEEPNTSFHRLVGVAATAMLIGHVLVSMASDRDPIPLAWIGLVVLLLLVAASLLGRRMRLRYEVWRVSHGLAAVIVAIAGFIHATDDGSYSSAGAMSAFWAILLVVALASLVVARARARRPESAPPTVGG